MLLTALLKGFTIGFLIAAPVGPIGILCIRRTLVQGRSIGFISGLGAATADAVYGCIAGLGLTLIMNYLVEQSSRFQLFGGIFLCYLGLRTLFSSPPDRAHGR
ncbi:LysE family translocator [Paenibacillus sp. DYY-L-2]|uniref:LysE family translocator n=1 Tax=Paenibacillus sp. DYY-L-2 TaxID=3447013 RepID=UPI003F4FD8BE